MASDPPAVPYLGAFGLHGKMRGFSGPSNGRAAPWRTTSIAIHSIGGSPFQLSIAKAQRVRCAREVCGPCGTDYDAARVSITCPGPPAVTGLRRMGNLPPGSGKIQSWLSPALVWPPYIFRRDCPVINGL